MIADLMFVKIRAYGILVAEYIDVLIFLKITRNVGFKCFGKKGCEADPVDRVNNDISGLLVFCKFREAVFTLFVVLKRFLENACCNITLPRVAEIIGKL